MSKPNSRGGQPVVAGDGSADNRPPPRYAQVRELLRREIATGLHPGDRLPSDAEMERLFAVSRVTARRAVADLVTEGLVERRRGSGTYVSDQPIRQDLYHPAGWTASLRTTGNRPVTLKVEINNSPASPRIASALDLREGSEIYRVRRICGAGSDPISLIINYVPVDLAPDLAETGLIDESMTATLRQHGHLPARVDETVEAQAATFDEAEALLMTAGAPVLVVAGTVSDAQGRPLMWSRVVSRGDRHRYAATHRATPE